MMSTWNLGLRKALLLIAAFCSVACQARDVRLFDEGWLFLLGDEPEMAQPGYDDSRWRQLSLPHDWAIEGDFSATNPSGAGGGALPGGVGWYRKHFRLPATEGECRYYLAFDGVYMNSTVYVNGHEVGSRPYGYSSFEYDLTPYVRPDSGNVVAVRVDNSDQPNSRWYSGCGIYRHVWLTATNPLHIARWGVHVVTDVEGTVDVELTVSGDADGQHRPMFRHTLLAPDGRTVAVTSAKSLRQKLRVRHPLRWSVDSPHLYTLRSEVLVEGEVVDVHDATCTSGEEITIFTCRGHHDDVFRNAGQVAIFQVDGELLPIACTFRFVFRDCAVSDNVFVIFREINRILILKVRRIISAQIAINFIGVIMSLVSYTRIIC